MKSRLVTGIALAMYVACAGSAYALEPYLEFVEGLRQHKYYDYAILYLDQIAAKDSTPAEIKQVIPYQKALTYQKSAESMSPEKALEQLNLAQDFLDQFVKDNPNHPSAADANSDRAGILLNKGRAENQQAKSPSNQGGKREMQKRAREYIAKAREVYQTAYDQHEANFKKFPVFIDQQKEAAQYAARARVEKNLVNSLLSLGMCSYEEAQTYDSGSNEFKQLLNKAADEFEKMHQKYRSQVGGLFARAWQGKCYEEQKDIQKALGIYNELLDHPGDADVLSNLKTQTLYFKLICLNSKDRHDHQLVVDLADEWLKKHKSETTSQMGLSIQWEQAQAFEALSEDRNLVLNTDKERFLKQARERAQEIQKLPSEYRDVATTMIQRITVKLGGKEQEPTDFNTAFGLGQSHFATAQEIKKELDNQIRQKAAPDEIAKMSVDYQSELKDAGRYFVLALKLAKPNDDHKSISKCRLYLSYVYFWQRKNYEAAVTAQFVTRTFDKDEESVGMDAAYISMIAFVQAYNEFKAPIDQKQEDMRLIVKAANYIAEKWPSSDKANESYFILGGMMTAQKNPEAAAGWYLKVPSTDPMYPESQLSAGQAYWTTYLGAARMTEKPTPEKLTSWLQSAETHLKTGIAEMSKKHPATGSAPPELIGAKLSLSHIFITQGKEAEALKVLLDDPQSVIKAVTVPDESQRPDRGVTSRPFAMAAYKTLLRAYIGTDNLDKARETMKKLEEIAAGGGVEGGAEITELYVDLGKKLKEELEGLRAKGDTEHYNKLMTSFETFLNDTAGRKEGQTFGTLSWIGETYFALGESISGDASKSTLFFEKAGNAFAEILNRVKDDANFASAMQIYGVKTRQVYVLRLKKEFAPAEALILDVIKESPNNLKVQTAAAELYQDWGSSGQADSVKKLIVAIQGTTKQKGGLIWGWNQISDKLKKSSEFPANPLYVENYLKARYNGTVCRQKYAREQTTKEKQKYLDGCKQELVITSVVAKDMPDEDYQKFNSLYREVLKELGQPVTDLNRAKDEPVARTQEKPEEVAGTDSNPKGPDKAPGDKPAETIKAEPPKSSGSTAMIIFVVFLLGGAGFIGWVFLKTQQQSKSKTGVFKSMAGPSTFSGIDLGDSAVATDIVAQAPKPKPRPATAGAKPAAGTKPAAKPATKPAAPAGAAGTAAPKPKPKPPSPPATK